MQEELICSEKGKIFNQLPDSFTIYRGGSLAEHKKKNYGISWTLDKKFAEQFADNKILRDKKEMIVIEKQIKKSDVEAYFQEREDNLFR